MMIPLTKGGSSTMKVEIPSETGPLSNLIITYQQNRANFPTKELEKHESKSVVFGADGTLAFSRWR